MRVFTFAAAGLLAAAAIAGGAGSRVTASPDCSDWPSGATCSAPELVMALPDDAKGEF